MQTGDITVEAGLATRLRLGSEVDMGTPGFDEAPDEPVTTI